MEGNELPAGQVGEPLVRGPSIVKGYYNRPEATAEAAAVGVPHHVFGEVVKAVLVPRPGAQVVKRELRDP